MTKTTLHSDVIDAEQIRIFRVDHLSPIMPAGKYINMETTMKTVIKYPNSVFVVCVAALMMS